MVFVSLALGVIGATATASPVLAAGSPASSGSWTAPFVPVGASAGTIGVHSVMLYTGKVLVFGPNTPTLAYVYDPASGKATEADPPVDVECAAVVPLSDGRILMVGGIAKGNVGITNIFLFDPRTLTWTAQPSTPLGRYYPVATRLADGRVVISGGTTTTGATNNTVEVYTPPPITGTVGTLVRVTDHVGTVFPRQYLMPDGKVLEVNTNQTFLLDPATWAWKQLPSQHHDHSGNETVALLPGGPAGSTKIIEAGGTDWRTPFASNSFAETFDEANPAAGWTDVTPLPETRGHMASTWTPDGKLVGVGGNSVDAFAGTPYYSALSYDPVAGTWTHLASQTARRDYHSSTVLLPDGRVFSAGDTGVGGGGNTDTVFSPPYLFQGPRPSITAAPTHVLHGAAFTVTTPDPGYLVLMSPGASTHTTDMNGRYVTLAQTRGAGTITATAPAKNVAPKGWYMVFVVSPSGVPSVGRWVHLD